MSCLTSGGLDIHAAVKVVESPSAGAILTFTGTVRNEHGGRVVTAIEYHAYVRMAVKEMDRIEAEIAARWPGARAWIIHRIGLLEVGEESIIIAVSSPHRAAGFEALRHAIEEIKKRAPIWKKEMYTDGYAWIEGS